MKKGILAVLLMGSLAVQGQSLRDALYSGRLKAQPGTVIRKGDDLKSLMVDSVQQKASRDSAAMVASTVMDSAARSGVVATDSTRSTAAANANDVVVVDSGATATAEPEATATPAAPAPKPKDNNALVRDYMTTVAATLTAEALPNKKVKKGTYYVTVSYAIETDGQLTVSDVFVMPENSYLQQQTKDRITLEAPKLQPVLNSSGTPRKVTRKHNLTLTKE
ncbi:hypothetical protein [Paracnuella aquatica]|uniref:hypothetical protein n=1 Tax=Paracnuella aquatica TaxID=2268757 RepID=UPI000DEF7996|nr:hypothetical protein [Paracnuella aquatica]RPD43563.1 hypothetical protein DRJ53_19685 [Paracnuella aquatica]